MSANWGSSSGCIHFSYQFRFVHLIIIQKNTSIFRGDILSRYNPDIYSRHLFIGLNNGFEQEYFGIYVHINIFQIVRFLCSIVFMFVFLRDLQRNFFNKGFSQWVSAMVSTRVSAMVSTRVSAMVSTRGISNIIRTNIPDTFFTYIDIQK